MDEAEDIVQKIRSESKPLSISILRFLAGILIALCIIYAIVPESEEELFLMLSWEWKTGIIFGGLIHGFFLLVICGVAENFIAIRKGLEDN